jgi:RNA polymerase sigma-70 factor, ECF subfamily
MVTDERHMIVRFQRWLTTRRQRPRQAHHGLIAAGLPALIAEAADGDQRALRELAGIVVPFVDCYCRIHLGTTKTAQQVARGVSTKILKTLPSYLRSCAPFWGYVYGVTARAVADAQHSSPEHSDPVHRFEGPSGQQLVDPSCARLVAQLLATLPAEQREVLVLRVPLRLTVEDTAKIVGTSPATVRLIQHRALNRLRQELQDGFHDSHHPT